MLNLQTDPVVEENFIGQMFSSFDIFNDMSTIEYAGTRWLSEEVTAIPGRLDVYKTPFMLFVMQCLDDPDIQVIVAKKSAQISWTETINNFIGRVMEKAPRNIIIAFPSTASAKSYAEEKFRPLIKSSPAILKKVGNPDLCRFDFYKYPGAFVKLVSAGSDNALKSTPAPILIVEEPDGLKEDLKGQGDSLEIFAQRLKTFFDSKLIYGGTAIEAEFSKVEAAYLESNQMVFMVICHNCSEFHTLDFKNLRCDPFPNNKLHRTFGKYNPETARYHCPHCDAIWDDKQKEANILESINYHWLGWKPTAESKIYGFHFNELLSSFPGSTLVKLAEKYHKALVKLAKGKDAAMKSFVNNSMGLAYSPRSSSLTVRILKGKRLDYPELIVPAGGIILTMGIDVQHNRFAVIIRAWGRNGNSWQVFWGELYGNVKDPDDPVWQDLEDMILATYPHALSTEERRINLPISAGSMDSSDGNTTQLVYKFVKRVNKKLKYFFAIKGDSEIKGTKEIFNAPSNPDTATAEGQRKKLTEAYGIHLYTIGTTKGKDEVYRKLELEGNKDRMYHYEASREDYEEQVLSNVKKNGRYALISGESDEALDCEVMNLHASIAIRLHLWTETHWSQAEKGILLANKPTERKSVNNVTGGLNI